MARIYKFIFKPAAAQFWLFAVVVALGLWYWDSRLPSDCDLTVAGAPFTVGRAIAEVTWTRLPDTATLEEKKAKPQENTATPPAEKATPPADTATPPAEKATPPAEKATPPEPPKLRVEPQTDDDDTTSRRVRLKDPGNYLLKVTSKTGVVVSRTVHVEPLSRLVWVAALFAVIALLIPYAFGAGPAGSGPWYHLLSETGGGYSLSRIQLLIWFLPTAVLYGALSFTLHDFGDINTQLAMLLGLSGATSLLGTAASPPAPPGGTGGAVVAPNLRDIVSDWDSNGDVSRYQYLLLSIFGAFVMVAAFFRLVEMPAIPSQLLYLVAGSQGTYVATKAIKAARAGDRSAPAAAPAPASMVTAGAPAPASIVAAGTPPAVGGSFVPADAAGPFVPTDS